LTGKGRCSWHLLKSSPTRRKRRTQMNILEAIFDKRFFRVNVKDVSHLRGKDISHWHGKDLSHPPRE
jgi:hypothetical protein